MLPKYTFLFWSIYFVLSNALYLLLPIYLLYDHSYCHELRKIESRASRLTERAMERAAQSPRTVISSLVVQFRSVDVICSRVKKRLVAS